MNRKQKQVGAVLGLVAISAFATWPFWKWLYIKQASAALSARTETLVENNPALQPLWKDAMQDEVLTWSEAKEIVEQGGQKLGPEE